jgi:hypothetical protein
MTDKQIIIDGTHCRYAHFDGGNTQRLLCAIDDCFCDCYRDNECYYKQLKRKEQECEELKETFDGLFKVQYKLADNNKKLRQCITEIKEIAEKIANYYDGDEYELMRKDAEQILQKISECEGNDD